MTMYVYCNETGQYLGSVQGQTNNECEAAVSERFGTNDVSATYTAPRQLESWFDSFLGTVKA